MLTQESYCLFTGQTVSYSDTDWQTLVSIASSRLASFLCLEKLPELSKDNEDLAMLLANFICSTLKFQGAPDEIESKQVRNFTIKFKSSATNAFEQLFSQYEDIIEKYSNCGYDVKVERDVRCWCGDGGYYGLLNF